MVSSQTKYRLVRISVLNPHKFMTTCKSIRYSILFISHYENIYFRTKLKNNSQKEKRKKSPGKVKHGGLEDDLVKCLTDTP